MRFSIRFRFIVPTITLIIIGMGIATAVTYVNSRGTLEEIIEQEKHQIVDLTLANISSWLKNRKLEVRYWCKQDIFGIVIEGSFHKIANKELESLKKDYEFYDAISVVSGAGSDDAAAGSLAFDGRQQLPSVRG